MKASDYTACAAQRRNSETLLHTTFHFQRISILGNRFWPSVLQKCGKQIILCFYLLSFSNNFVRIKRILLYMVVYLIQLLLQIADSVV